MLFKKKINWFRHLKKKNLLLLSSKYICCIIYNHYTYYYTCTKYFLILNSGNPLNTFPPVLLLKILVAWDVLYYVLSMQFFLEEFEKINEFCVSQVAVEVEFASAIFDSPLSWLSGRPLMMLPIFWDFWHLPPPCHPFY